MGFGPPPPAFGNVSGKCSLFILLNSSSTAIDKLLIQHAPAPEIHPSVSSARQDWRRPAGGARPTFKATPPNNDSL